ncbi:hypothetical protein [Haloferula sp. A504]|uniref:hypothetical protein n=1 Tax=Haloferula sp. A504 TaxID=3373601 RepID=UPI0037C049BB
MAYIDLDKLPEADRNLPMSVIDGVSYAHTAIQFAALALVAGERQWGFPKDHLFALAIELAFKSLALRSGSTVIECRSAGHDPEKMIALIEKHGATVPTRLKTRLSDKEWFKAFLFMSRYPALSELNTSLEKTIFLHPDYPEMIAEILEADCRWPLSFDPGGALHQIRTPSSRMIMARATERPPGLENASSNKPA